MKSKTTSRAWKTVYMFALLPIVSVLGYLLLMSQGMAENLHPVGIVALILMTFVWGFVGSRFARAGVTVMRSILIANIFPIFCAVAYTVIGGIAKIADSTTFFVGAELIGGLGTGIFGIFGTLVYSVIPLDIFEIYVNLLFSVLVFTMGFATASFGRKSKKR